MVTSPTEDFGVPDEQYLVRSGILRFRETKREVNGYFTLHSYSHVGPKLRLHTDLHVSEYGGVSHPVRTTDYPKT